MVRLPKDKFSASNEIVALKSVLTELKRFLSRVVSLPLIKKKTAEEEAGQLIQ